MCDENKVKIN
uniref:Uncharacterized protein n=1 Tax=Rhizophora mucronata TaxID=61149 RepID=A0A2P2Q1R6_RHIMU